MAIDLFTNQANIKQVIQRIRTSTTNVWAILGFSDIEFNEPLQQNQIVCLTVLDEGLNSDFKRTIDCNRLFYMYINAESYREGGVRKRSLVYWIGEDITTNVVNSYTHCIPIMEGIIRARECLFIARNNNELFSKLNDDVLLMSDSNTLGRAHSVVSYTGPDLSYDRTRTRSVPIVPTVAEPATRKHRNLKVIMIGNADTGKTSIARFLHNGQITTVNHPTTIGIDMFTVRMTVDNRIVTLDIMDTAGQERYNALPRSYYRNANGVVLVYSCDDRDSFLALPEWLNKSRQCSLDCLPVFILLGNKKDTEERTVQIEEGQAFVRKEGMFFVETSARVNGDNIMTAFLTLIRIFNSVDRNFAVRVHSRARAQTEERGVNIEIDPTPTVNLNVSNRISEEKTYSSRCCEE